MAFSKQSKLINNIEETLGSYGFSSVKCGGCFDIIAKRKDIYLFKVLHNLDSFTLNESINMKTASYFTSAYPVIVSKRTRKGRMEKGVLHRRFGIPAISEETFKEFMEGVLPHIFAAKSGKFINIDTKKAEAILKNKKMTVNDIASTLHLTRKTARKCITGGRYCVETSSEIERIMDGTISKGIDIRTVSFSCSARPSTTFERKLLENFKRIDIEFGFVHRSSFNFAAKEKLSVVARATDNVTILKKTASTLKKIESNIGIKSFMITEKTKKRYIEGVPVMTIENVKNMKNKEELYSFLNSM